MQITYSEDFDCDVDSIDIVIYTPAISKDQKVFQYFHSRGAVIVKRSEALEKILEQKKVIAIAGTHGKTSTCALLAHICKDHDLETSAFVGGLMSGYETNFIYGSGDWVIVEADEYDRSFWRLYPDIAVINALDADHLDIYDTHEAMIAAYKVFTLQIQEGGRLYVSDFSLGYIDEEWKQELKQRRITLTSFGIQEVDVRAQDVHVQDGKYHFSIDEKIFRISQPGLHNVYNSLGALAVARDLKLTDDEISQSLLSFRGIERRFELRLQNGDVTIIDDYAHHPVEVEKTIEAVRMLYPEKSVTAIFQPHLYSRTRDLKEGFAKALDKADEIILVELYPAREQPIEGVSSLSILDLMDNESKVYVKKEKLEKHLSNPRREILLFMGAGDANRLINDIIIDYTR